MGAVRDALEEWASKIRGRVCLPDVFQVVYPREFEDSIERIRRVLSREFGGTTEWDGYGCWIDERGEEVCEPVKVIMSAHHCTDAVGAAMIAETLAEVAEKDKQEAVFIGAGNKFFVLPTRALKPPEIRIPTVE